MTDTRKKMTYDFLIEKKFDIYPLMSQKDKIICIDIHPVNQTILMLLKCEQKYELVICDSSSNFIKRKSIISPHGIDNFSFTTIRFLQNGLIFAFGGDKYNQGPYGTQFFDSSSLNLVREVTLGGHTHHVFIFNQDSVHALIRNYGLDFMFVKIESDKESFAEEKAGTFFNISKFLEEKIETNNAFFYGMHALADNTIVVCSNNNGLLYLSFCKIKNDDLVLDSVVKVDEIIQSHLTEHARHSFLTSFSEEEFILRLSPLFGNIHNVYYLKKLENSWKILPDFFYSSAIKIGWDETFRSAPFFTEGDEYNNTYRLVDLKTKAAFIFPKTCEFLPARDSKLYILNEDQVFLAFFAEKTLQNTLTPVLNSFFADDIIELVASYVNPHSFFSYRALSDSSTRPDLSQTNVLGAIHSPKQP